MAQTRMNYIFSQMNGMSLMSEGYICYESTVSLSRMNDISRMQEWYLSHEI